MSNIDRRHRGRAIRRNRRLYPGTGLVFVSIAPDISGFEAAMDLAIRRFSRWHRRAYSHPRPVLHNGKKPRK